MARPIILSDDEIQFLLELLARMENLRATEAQAFIVVASKIQGAMGEPENRAARRRDTKATKKAKTDGVKESLPETSEPPPTE